MTRSIDLEPQDMNISTSVGEVSLGVRGYLSIDFLRSAKKFAALARKIEDEHPGEWKAPYVEDNRDYVISSVINSVSFLEAIINELYTDAAEGVGSTNDGVLVPLSEDTKRLMADWWNETNGRMNVLAKYQLLLVFAGKPKLPKNDDPIASADLLIQFRNKLVHYKPKTVYQEPPRNLESKLVDKFEGNKLSTADGPYWTSIALGAGAAHWAIETAQELADVVSEIVGIEPGYMKYLRDAK